MEIIFLITGIVVALVLFIVTLGAALNDIRLIRLEKSVRLHPHARRWRTRPLISLVNSDALSEEAKKALRRTYKKITFISDKEQPSGELVLKLQPNTMIDRITITQAIWQFNNDPDLRTIRLSGIPMQPQTTTQLFRSYHAIVALPFLSAQAGLLSSGESWHLHFYAIARKCMQLLNAAVLAVIIYMALILHQPDLLLLYLASFSLWLVWSIVRHTHLTTKQKTYYLLLSPSSFVYFAYRAMTAPFLPAYQAPVLLYRPKNAIMET